MMTAREFCRELMAPDSDAPKVEARDAEWQARVDEAKRDAAANCNLLLEIQRLGARREGWEAGMRALRNACATLFDGMAKDSIVGFADALIAQGSK